MRFQIDSLLYRRTRAEFVVLLTPPYLPWREMRLRHVGVDFDSKPWLVFDREVAILPERPFMHDKIGPPVDPTSPAREYENHAWMLPHAQTRLFQ